MQNKKKRTQSSSEFFHTHPIFTTQEFENFLHQRGRSENPQTRRNSLHSFSRRGVILPVRRGIYCSVPPGTQPEVCPIDGYLLASKLAKDAVLGYHAALELHGRSYSVHNLFLYLTKKYPAGRIFRFRGMTFRSVAPPTRLLRAGKESFGVTGVDRQGQDVKVTTLERTLVDVLDRPKLAGGWEEIWRSLETIPYFNIDQIVEYALILAKRKTIAKVGFYLEQHAKELMVTDIQLAALEKKRPEKPQYFSRKSAGEPGKVVPRWNLIVPQAIISRAWEEPQ